MGVFLEAARRMRRGIFRLEPWFETMGRGCKPSEPLMTMASFQNSISNSILGQGEQFECGATPHVVCSNGYALIRLDGFFIEIESETMTMTDVMVYTK